MINLGDGDCLVDLIWDNGWQGFGGWYRWRDLKRWNLKLLNSLHKWSGICKWIMILEITEYPFKWVKDLPCAQGSISNF